MFLEKTRLLSSLKMSVSAVLKDVNDSKLQLQSERLRESFKRGEPKAMGVTEIMLGLMTVTIAMPLIASNPTHTVNLLTPWWSGAVFVISGAVAVATEKQPTICNMRMCLLCTALGVAASFTSLIVYTVDLSNATLHCTAQEWKCKEHELANAFSSGLKSILLTYSVTQLIIGGVLLYLLNKERRSFSTYNTLDFNSQSGPDSELLRS